MTHFQQKKENAFGQLRRGLPSLLVVAMIVLVISMGVFWHKTSTRVTALEARLAELTEVRETSKISETSETRETREVGKTRETSRPDQNWRLVKLEHAIKNLEDRINERFMSKIEARGQTVMPSQASVEPDREETIPVEAHDGNDMAQVQVRGEDQTYSAALKSMYSSLELAPEREVELGTGLEDMLDNIWPEFVSLQESPDADPTALKRLYCDEAWSILTPEEAGRLGC